MHNQKLKDNNGSAMILAILLVALVSVFAILVSSQLSNQIRSTTNTYNDMQGKYISESGIEVVLQEACNQLNTKIREASNSSSTRTITTRLSNTSQTIDNMKKELQNLKTQLSSILNVVDISSIINKINSISTAEDLISGVGDIRKDMLNVLVNENGSSSSNNVQSSINKSIEYLHNAQHYAQLYKNKDVEPLLLRNSNYWEDVNYNQGVLNRFINGREVQGIISEVSTCNGYLGWNSQSQIIHDKAWQINDMIWEYHDLFNNDNKNPLESESVKNQLEKLNQAIDVIIKDINNLQLNMISWYTNKDYDRNNLEKVFELFDNIKNDYIYVKKKLGLAIEDNTEPLPPSSEGGINLDLDNYKNNLNTQKNTYSYEVEYQDEDKNIVKQISKPINIIRDQNQNILSVSDTEVDIVSSAYKVRSENNSKIQYRIKATVVFKIYKDDNFKVKYEIKSYETMPIK